MAPSRFAPTPAWLADAVLYQIYPQSFADSNGDGVGDLPGLLGRLDYLSGLGVDTVWLSPLFASPFLDAGYDVADYLTVAPRYGRDADLVAVVDAARERGIRIMLDLVAGHTSDQHPWFQASMDDPDDDRYIWTDAEQPPGPAWVKSPGERPGHYLPNFYAVQPALNFGYARLDPREPWRQLPDAPGPRRNREALREIMAHWFDLGVAGFRVDMAASLVKDDDAARSATAALWTEMREWLDAEHPDRVLLSEWGDPEHSVPAGIHTDFFLHFVGRGLRSLWGNAQGSHNPVWGTDPCYFAPEGEGSMREFLEVWRQADTAIDGSGYVALPTANHDFSRLTCGTRTRDMVAPAFAFLLTWPSLPVIYFGDEIGMRYIAGLPDKEGSQLGPEARQGSRTPMQWDAGENAGFSTAKPQDLYLPLDPSENDRPNVEAQEADPDSLLNQVKALIGLRRAHPALGTRASARVLTDGYPFVYTRGERYLVAVNPSSRDEEFVFEADMAPGARLVGRGMKIEDGVLRAGPFSYAVWALGD